MYVCRAQQVKDADGTKSGKSKKKSQLGKSASVMEHLSPRHSSHDNSGFDSRSRRTVAAPDAANSTSLSNLRRGISLERQTSCVTEGRRPRKDHAADGDAKKSAANSKKKKSSSESDLLNAGILSNGGAKAGGYRVPPFSNHPDSDFPAPPKPEDLLLMSASETLETVTGTEGTEGFYRSFDDIDDIDLGVLASSNPLEAAVVLRNQVSILHVHKNSVSAEKLQDKNLHFWPKYHPKY
jgi:hypothetical protein